MGSSLGPRLHSPKRHRYLRPLQRCSRRYPAVRNPANSAHGILRAPPVGLSIPPAEHLVFGNLETAKTSSKSFARPNKLPPVSDKLRLGLAATSRPVQVPWPSIEPLLAQRPCLLARPAAANGFVAKGHPRPCGPSPG